MNIILEGIDLTGKSYITKKLEKKLYNKGYILVSKDIFQLQDENKKNIEEILNIKDIDYIIKTINQIDKGIFDRHILSLLVYWKINNLDEYNKWIDEEKIIKDIIINNKNSFYYFLYHSFSAYNFKFNQKINKKPDDISEHDKKLLDKGYFYSYSNTFHKIYELLENENKKLNNNIILNKESMGKMWPKNMYKKILANLKKNNYL